MSQADGHIISNKSNIIIHMQVPKTAEDARGTEGVQSGARINYYSYYSYRAWPRGSKDVARGERRRQRNATQRGGRSQGPATGNII